MTIKAKDPVCEAFAGYSTGTNSTDSYDSKGAAVSTFDNALQCYDYHLYRDDLADFHGNEGHKVIHVHNESNEVVGHAVISWRRVPNGRYRFVGYLA